MGIIDRIQDFKGARVTVMGLGLHGGGVASARFFASVGAEVTVTDLRDRATLEPSIRQLEGLTLHYTLGAHRERDFSDADIVIKNPAVRADSPYLKLARRIETDISIFLRYSRSPLIAVTGSKGKSSVASAIWYTLNTCGRKALLGGNITVSPLDFLDATADEVPVVLELSSWQLGDLRGRKLLKPNIAVLTAIYPDHLNSYGTMESYVADKRVIYENQDASTWTVCCADQTWGRSFASETRGRVLWYSERNLTTSVGAQARGGWLESEKPGEVPSGYGSFDALGTRELLVPSDVAVQGLHQKKNLLAAAVALRAFGISSSEISLKLKAFPGIPHRLERVAEAEGITWFNDSAATIPDAAIAAIHSFSSPVVLIAGGSDKLSDFTTFAATCGELKAVILLAGSGTERMIPLLDANHVSYKGPFNTMKAAVKTAAACAAPGDVVLLSPGCASFGLFLHEFERGDSFKREVRELFKL